MVMNGGGSNLMVEVLQQRYRLMWAVISDSAVCHSTQRTQVQTLPEEITTTSSATQFPIKELHCFGHGLNPATFPQETPGRRKLECASDQLMWTSLANDWRN
ncbi:hypothetical protein LXL04_024796 [Taraxacum kok-saghyz]